MSNSILVVGVAFWSSFGPVMVGSQGVPGPEAKQPIAATHSEPKSIEEQAIIEDIAHIRQLVGNPSGLELDGFKNALAEFVEVEPLVVQKESSTDVAEEFHLQSVSSEESGNQELVGQLRTSAELLDEKANSFERSGKYQKADRLRALANRLRREARQH